MIIMIIVKSAATIWSDTLEPSIMLIEASFTLLEVSFMMFIAKASLTMEHHTLRKCKQLFEYQHLLLRMDI
jgi:hypothetical protein